MGKKFLIIANWKENVTAGGAVDWVEKFAQLGRVEGVEIVIAPPFPLLSVVNEEVAKNNLQGVCLAAQDVSMEPSGAHTGEVAAKLLAELGVRYVLVGHSERRALGETNEIVYKKFYQAHMAGLVPILCAQNEKEIPEGAVDEYDEHEMIIMYEPATAISTPGNFHPENPGKVAEVISNWREKYKTKILYGGSINAENIKSYVVADGFVVGQASLNSDSFWEIIKGLEGQK